MHRTNTPHATLPLALALLASCAASESDTGDDDTVGDPTMGAGSGTADDGDDGVDGGPGASAPGTGADDGVKFPLPMPLRAWGEG